MYLDYHEEPPALWSKLLESFRAQGRQALRSRVCWGAHEQVRGIRDFSRSSRLRLEKFLRLAHSFDLSIEMVLGFAPGGVTFPPWVYERPTRSLIPSGLWDGRGADYGQSPIPSIFDHEVLESFLDFLQEVSALLALYRKPEGPVSEIYLDLGLFEHDLSANESQDFPRQLERRYPKLEVLNTMYRSSFRDFRAPCSAQGLRVLSERRPWLAAYDYQWCREALLRELRQRFGGYANPPPVSIRQETGSWQLAVDSMLFQVAGSECFPLVLGGQPNPSSVSAFRMAEYLSERAQSAGVEITWLGMQPQGASLHCENVLVVCGKYMSRACWEALDRHAKGGASIKFVGGLPAYDETLQSLPQKSAALPCLVDESMWSHLCGLVGGAC